jgi:hypothetical protein
LTPRSAEAENATNAQKRESERPRHTKGGDNDEDDHASRLGGGLQENLDALKTVQSALTGK